MKLAIFGGSFNPVHNEHISVCKAAKESLETDLLFVVPTHLAPHKQGVKPTADRLRFAMCQAAFSSLEGVVLSDCEMKSGGTSYTYLTIVNFRRQYPTDELYFIVGTDMLRDFKNWKNPEKILSLCTLAVCARDEEDGWVQTEKAEFYQRFQTDFAVIPYNGKPVSSTKIRTLAACKELTDDYTPKAVCEFIKEHNLYALEFVERVKNLQKPSRWAHTVRVATYATEHAKGCGVDEKKALYSAVLHDCAKNLTKESELLQGFTPPDGVPDSVWHQYAGAFLAKEYFGIQDEDILNAVRFHTSGREDMSDLEKLIFLSDMLEDGRSYPEMEIIEQAFEKGGLDAGMETALLETLKFLKQKGAEIYPLTQRAYEFIKERRKRL